MSDDEADEADLGLESTHGGGKTGGPDESHSLRETIADVSTAS